jgi:hypothetical protein
LYPLNLTLDGTDLIGRVFNDPDLGLCRIVEVGPPHRLAPGEGNLDPTGTHLQANILDSVTTVVGEGRAKVVGTGLRVDPKRDGGRGR